MLLLLAISAPAFAAGSTDFYLTLLRRGAADVEAGRHADATATLRLAAFGLLESIEHYETAQAYLAVAFDHLGQTDEARQAAQRVVAAERVEKKFRGIALPTAIRTAFESVAKKVLSATDASALSGGATAPVTAAPAIVDKVDVVMETRKPVTVPAKPVETPKVTPPAPKPQTQTSQPPKPQPQTQKPPTQPAPVQPQRTTDVSAQLSAAERALTTANINEARRVYRDLLTVQGLDHGTMIRIGEGLYRSRDFANVLAAFDRAGALRSGEEAYRYYLAVAAFEVGQFDRARRELAGALPFIELTPDVQRYRTKIEAAR
jgi:outer membrane biosynthesis protein TonB